MPANLDTHTRQESGDSGLSLPSSSTSQSASHTPDFLSNIDDSMDGLSGMFPFLYWIFLLKLYLMIVFWLSVTDNTMDTMPFNDNIDNSDEFMVSLFWGLRDFSNKKFICKLRSLLTDDDRLV